MIHHLQGDIRTAVETYHRALSLGAQDPMATVLLEMALSEQTERLPPNSIPGLPPSVADDELDPFVVHKGNAAFTPHPARPIQTGGNAHGHGQAEMESGLGMDRLGVPVGMSTPIDRRTRRAAEGEEEAHDGEWDEGSTMDIEDD